MPPSSSDIGSRRLDLAGTRDFHVAGAGRARRAALSSFNRDWLAQVWRTATGGARYEGVALAAVGSLGRGDAGPLSDYDLVLLHSERSLGAKELGAFAERLWYPIWDAGVRLDHSVRTVTQSRQVAAADLIAAVGLLDLTAIAGDEELVVAARSTVAHDWRGNARKRLPQLVEALEGRHARQGDLAQSIEPELKEAHGGLRDMTVLTALAEAWLTDRPHGAVDTAHELLLDVRDAVHVVTGRGRDRLGREEHDAVAALLGYPDADELLTAVSDAGRLIAYSLDGTMRRAGQSQRARTLRVGPRRPQMTPLGHGFFVSDGEVVLGTPRLAESDPGMALRAGVVAARAGLPLAPATLENLAASVPSLPDPWPASARDLLGDLLAAGPGLVTVWEGLDQVGIVEHWLPEWAAVRSRPQRSAVHRHTVDRHLVETVVRAAGLVRRTSRPDLLLAAALLHDIGKVRGAHDHSVTGAELARGIAARWGFGAADVEILVRLVREHLTVIELATRRDHQDPATVDAAVEAAGGDREVFEILLALTEADASAAGPLAWTDWRATLLEQLAVAVRDRLDAPRPAPGSAVSRADQTVGVLAPEAAAAVRAGEPQVRVVSGGGSHRLDILDVDRVGLFADTAGLLAAEGHTVRTAILRTVDDVAINEWHVESPSGAVPDPERIARGLARLARGDRGPLQTLDRRRAHLARPSGESGIGSPGQARALVVPGASTEATVIEVRAQDRPGLLHELGAALARAGISVRSAHIATYAGQTLDTFYLTGADGQPLPPARVAQAVSLVIDTCDGVTAA
ncbi:[protein-PII] uridylyltransferase [Phycicoccus endophyticus]|uniref:Bifunctional uridylyltransferase/uridylyl-removing enzyme n=1 Tax=Phycicoccus endophyticus TaxID=1690220 RepID=A0A7G9QY93_9MICO|nr:[protein-PII] uridylyltransferase [Phycicoccus endophyticus]NHI19208.1 [protein-PII] uridylyltransferase [Phycicoccus endophyticus]QNN48318.1 [protein-PII] uridylyltransferase [Phycicoccus endophyticus]GGL40980.1 bifunctional uridylyltransferase/uridylyl-removing enzyme [Phycicoccus endophyticus]